MTAESPTPENEWTTEILEIIYEMVQLNETLPQVQTEIKSDIRVKAEMTEQGRIGRSEDGHGRNKGSHCRSSVRCG